MNVVEMLVRQGTGVFVRDCPLARSGGFVHARLINALVPPQRILRRNGGGNVGGASRAHAVLALAAVRAAIVGAEESTAHQSRTAVAGILHLIRPTSRGNRAGATVALTLALVAAGNNEHGGADHGTTTYGPHEYTHQGSALLARLARLIVAGSTKGIVVVVGASVAALGSIVVIVAKANFRFNLSSQISHQLIAHGVELRVGNPDAGIEQRNQSLGEVHLGNRGNKARSCASVVRNKRRNLAPAQVMKVGGISASRKKRPADDTRSVTMIGHEVVVERVLEADLDQFATLGSRISAIRTYNDVG